MSSRSLCRLRHCFLSKSCKIEISRMVFFLPVTAWLVFGGMPTFNRSRQIAPCVSILSFLLKIMRGFVSNQHKSFNLAKNTGKEYEQFVAELQQALLNTEAFIQQKNVKVEVNKIIVDNCGIKRQFDIYWEYELGGITYKTVIECKDYNSKISVDRIDGFLSLIHI